MKVSTILLKTWFDEFNREYFHSSLPVPKFVIGNARTQLGAMAYKWKSVMGRKEYYGYTIRISNYYDADEKQFKNVLLHEMIHYYIVIKGIKDTSSHGVVFRRIMNEMNARGWNITVRTDTRNWNVAGKSSTKGETFLVLAAVTHAGKHLLSVVNPAYARRIERIMKLSQEVKWHAFYTSCDSFFSSFPKVRSPRGRIVSPAVFMKKTDAMNRTDFKG
ncbi:SprT-like domain-containing protein [Xylanibacter caecicola]|uniref:SprT-like domain-containing protein n=1 Tax=Xylanibacter caecicola TaxID=2736294 RepID=UPI00258E3C4E|nr:SprT-like domain-containing protein [Xylanibacter caecicola]